MSAPALALVLGIVFAPIGLTVLRRRVLDHPSERSSHIVPTPRGGGVSIAIAATAAIAVGADVPMTGRVALAAAPLAFGMLGFADDLQPVRPERRLVVQLLLSLGTAALILDDLVGPILWQALFAVAVVVWIVAYVNAFNFMDGLNGIATGTAIIGGAAWSLIGRAHDVYELEVAGAVLVLATAGFVPMNFPRARIFLGDAGSYFLGSWCAVCVVLGVRAGIPMVSMLAPTLAVIGDTSWTILQRARRGEQLMVAHRDHVYQRLVRQGWPHAAATFVVLVLGVVASLVGSTVVDADIGGRVAAAAVLVLLLAAYLSLPVLARSRRPETSASET